MLTGTTAAEPAPTTCSLPQVHVFENDVRPPVLNEQLQVVMEGPTKVARGAPGSGGWGLGAQGTGRRARGVGGAALAEAGAARAVVLHDAHGAQTIGCGIVGRQQVALDRTSTSIRPRADLFRLPHLPRAPPGDLFLALRRSGALAHMRRAGVRCLEVQAVEDNVMARPLDPAFLGACAATATDCAAKVAVPGITSEGEAGGGRGQGLTRSVLAEPLGEGVVSINPTPPACVRRARC